MTDQRVSTQQLLQIIGQKQIQIEMLLVENEQLHLGLESLKAKFEEMKGKKKPKKEPLSGGE